MSRGMDLIDGGDFFRSISKFLKYENLYPNQLLFNFVFFFLLFIVVVTSKFIAENGMLVFDQVVGDFVLLVELFYEIYEIPDEYVVRSVGPGGEKSGVVGKLSIGDLIVHLELKDLVHLLDLDLFSGQPKMRGKYELGDL